MNVLSKNEFTKKQIGSLAEELALKYLKSKQYKILKRNYRYKKGEVDIIGEKENTLIFIEVKFRSSLRHGYPEDFVTERKIELFHSCADNFIQETNWIGNIRFDIIAIHDNNIEHFQDAF